MSQPLSMSTKIASSEHILSSDIGDEMVMMSIDEGKYFSLKGPSGRVWGLIEQGTDVQSIHQALVAEYDVDTAQCEKELLDLLNELYDKNLITLIS